jgi:hypothetical protein
MCPRIVHFGLDKFYRIAVLKNAGYTVLDGGNSISRLRATLVGVEEVDAVVISESDGVEPDEAISSTDSNSQAPLILFQSRRPHYDESEFDLVVRILTNPREWLHDIGELIEQHSVGSPQTTSQLFSAPPNARRAIGRTAVESSFGLGTGRLGEAAGERRTDVRK